MKFSEMHLIPEVVKALQDMRIEETMPIQERAIFPILEGKDVIGQAATGSGKTIAFGVPLIEKVQQNADLQALVLVPTRELCTQVTQELQKLARYKRLEIVSIFGGVSIEPQVSKARRANIVIATPGRLLDLMERRAIILHNISSLIIDEADHMFDIGFIVDVRKIISQVPNKRQTLLFSATFPKEVRRLVDDYMRDPQLVKVKEYVDKEHLKHLYYVIPGQKKFSLLVHLLKQETTNTVVIFCGTRRNVDFVAHNLAKNGVDAVALHGGMTQGRRTEVMRHFHEKRVHALVASDVAARGIDFKNISHVYNYDVPKDSKGYIHRVGRTARAGSIGKAVTLLAENDYDNFNRILSERVANIERLHPPTEFPNVNIERPVRRGYVQGPRGHGGQNQGPRRFNPHYNFRRGRHHQRTFNQQQ